MADSTFPTGTRLRGVLRPEQFARYARFGDASPSPATDYWIARIWSVTWDLPPNTHYSSEVVAHPSVSLTVERGAGQRDGRTGDGVWLTGVVTRRFAVDIHGRGGVVGVKFRPGALTALTGRSCAPLTDRVLPAPDWLPGTGALADLPLDAAAAGDALCAYVEGFGAGPDPRYDEVCAVLDRLADERVTRVEDLARECALSERSLQRLLREYVGVGPKWLLMRQRLHDAVDRIDAGYDGPLADLAVGLGWYDQNHFIRDFTAIVGVTPAVYRDRPL